MWLERVAGGVAELITMEDAKSHLRLLQSDFDLEVQNAIESACAFLDVDDEGCGGLGFPLVAQAWRLTLPGFGGAIALPFQRVSGVQSVSYRTASGDLVTLDASRYSMIKRHRSALVCSTPGASWPATGTRADAVRVEFTAGWTDVASVPADVKAACRLLVGHFFENRENEARDTPSRELMFGVDRLCARYKAVHL